MAQPKQPTTQVRQPDSPDTKTMRSNDPITNREEERLANEAQQEIDRISEEQVKQQEEEAKRQQEEHDKKMELYKSIISSPEGFVKPDEGNTEAVGLALSEGTVYNTPVQSGKGGLDVEERYYLSAEGVEKLRTAFGPSLGKK
jgi:hypothetical protein